MQILNTLLEITIYATIIYVVTIIIKRLFKDKLSPFLHYAIWSLLILRLLLPVTVVSPVQLIVLPESAPAVAEQAENAEIQTPTTGALLDGNAALPIGQPLPSDMSDAQGIPAQPAPATVAKTKLPVTTILLIVWLTGVGIGITYLAVLYSMLRRRIIKNAVKPAKRLCILYREVRKELGVKAKVPLVCQYGLDSPGILFPACVLMPMEALAAMDDEQVKNALRHELTHYQRGDQVVSILLSILNAFYWFNPVVWLAMKEIRADMETACDSRVVRRMNAREKGDYANLILELFSRSRYRQVVLGMAHGKTKSVAEQRIKGIFMNGKSKAGAKAICVMMTVILLVGCFTTACVPKTRENSAASSIGGANGAAAADDSEHGTTTLPGASAHLSFERTLFDGLLTLKVDADAALPHASPYRTYRMADVSFTQEQVDTMVRVLMHREPTYSVEGSKITKEEALLLLNWAKDTLSRLEAGEVLGDDSGPYTIEGMREAVASYQEMYDTAAPEQRTDAAAEQYTKQGSLRLFADLGQEQRAELEIPRYEADGITNQMSFSNGMEYCLDDNGDDQLPQGVAITRDEAIALAKGLVADLGADYMELAFVGRRSRGDGSEFDIQSDEYRNTQCHMMIFTRTVDGIPTIADDHAYIRLGPSGTKSLDGFFERIYVAVDDSGIRHVVWRGHKELREVVSEDLMLLDPAQLTEGIISAVEKEYVSLANRNVSLRWQSADITINRVVLNYVARATGEGDYLLKPVWDCFGISDMRLYPDEVAAYNAEYDVEIPVVHYKDDPAETICSIDAESGAPYDKYRGIFGDA